MLPIVICIPVSIMKWSRGIEIKKDMRSKNDL